MNTIATAIREIIDLGLLQTDAHAIERTRDLVSIHDFVQARNTGMDVQLDNARDILEVVYPHRLAVYTLNRVHLKAEAKVADTHGVDAACRLERGYEILV